MAHTLPQLPYAYNALEPHIDETTMRIHHTRHHQAYVDKLNAALEAHPDQKEKPLEDLLRQIDTLPEAIRAAVRNHGGGHANHSFFWETLKVGVDPHGEVVSAIEKEFGSFTRFQDQFAAGAAGLFGSGWMWLVLNRENHLELLPLPNQDSPVMFGKTPVLGLDVWEHAYYLKYQNRRPDYIAAFFSVINWDRVNAIYKKALT